MKLNVLESEKVFELAEELTGSCQEGRFRREILVSNIERRIEILRCKNLDQYLSLARDDEAEWKQMLSALTIHTTSWFRESPHFELLNKVVEDFIARKEKRLFRLWSSACSTGEEVYSAGLVLERFRMLYPDFQYEISGSDIDPVSVAVATKAIYVNQSTYQAVPAAYRFGLMIGSGRTEGFLTLAPEIRKASRFFQANLEGLHQSEVKEHYDWIFCRNVLIYFHENAVKQIIDGLKKRLSPEGVLCLGHSEAQPGAPSGLVTIGPAAYQNQVRKRGLSAAAQKKKVQDAIRPKILVVDDSGAVRAVLKKVLTQANFEVWEAESAEVADQQITKMNFDLITLDLHMPKENGASWLRRFRKSGNQTKVIILSDADPKEAEEVFGALEDGAQDYVMKSSLSQGKEEFIERVKGLTKAKTELRLLKKASEYQINFKKIQPEVILIGASTGGPEALARVLRGVGNPQSLPIVVVQHINPSFAKPFAQRIASIAGLPIQEPKNGEHLERGRIYLAFDHYHLGIVRTAKGLCLQLSESPPLHGHRPAVDFLFESAAVAKVRALSVLMTGMGRDGAKGMLDLFNTKLTCNVTQDEESSIVYGMPKEAVEKGASHVSGNLEEISEWIKKAVES